jgi:hypothetical protein
MVSKFIKKAFELPKSKSEWVITVCWIIHLVIEIGLDIFYDIDPYAASDSELFYLWLFHQIRDASLVIALSCMIIIGIRSIRRDGFTLKRAVLPMIAVLLCVLITGISIYGHKALSRVHQTLFDISGHHKERLKEISDNEDLSLSMRSKASLMYAKQIWQETGENVEYISSDGNEILYEPSKEEIETKKTMNKSKEFIFEGIKGMKRAYIFWPIFLVANIIIGFLTPIKKENYLTNIVT